MTLINLVVTKNMENLELSEVAGPWWKCKIIQPWRKPGERFPTDLKVEKETFWVDGNVLHLELGSGYTDVFLSKLAKQHP